MGSMDGWNDDEDFFEEDEDVVVLLARWAAAERAGLTFRAREPCCYDDVDCEESATPDSSLEGVRRRP